MRTMRLMLAVTFAVTTGFADELVRPMAALAPLVQHVEANRDGKAPHSIDFAALEGDRSQLPIGVFDSGIGGLTVLEAILKLDAFNNATLQPGPDGVPDFAGERFLYLGDQANMPYGNYPAKGREDYLRELILKDAVFLLGRRYHGNKAVRFDKPPVKAIVIACNTATAYGIADIRVALKTWDLEVPVIGVVEAGARAVVDQLPSEGKAPTVGVLATVGTCSSNAYPKAIARAAGLAGKPVPLVVQQGSVGLAGAIEGNPAFVWNGPGERPVPYAGPQGAASPLNSVVEHVQFDVGRLGSEARDRGAAGAGPLAFVVLGCTHFPLAEGEIARAFRSLRADDAAYGSIIGDRITFINPAEHTAKELFRELARTGLRHNAAARDAPSSEFFLSVPNPAAPGLRLAVDGSLDPEYKHSRITGALDREDTKVVRMSLETLPASSGALLRQLGAVSSQLQGVHHSGGAP